MSQILMGTEPVWEEVDAATGQPFAPTSDGHAILAAILLQPEEDTPRVVYADWIQEHGDAERAEFIRVQCELSRTAHQAVASGLLSHGTGCVVGCRACTLLAREGKLLTGPRPDLYEHEVIWFNQGNGTDTWRFLFRPIWSRGFVQSVTCGAGDWLTHGHAIQKKHPVTSALLSQALELDFTAQANDQLATGCKYTVRVSARGWCEGEPLPETCYLSSPATDVLVTDWLCDCISWNDFRRAVFDRFWPGVEIESPEPQVRVTETGYGESRGRDSVGTYRRRTFEVSGVRRGEAAVRAVGIAVGEPHHMARTRYFATAFEARPALALHNTWTVTVTYRTVEERQ